jgi:pimeloyl-ACP methyl ester carboxylesterase
MSSAPGLKFSDIGKGPSLILLHGFCESRLIWKDFAKNLSLNYRVICIDLPGFGESMLDQDEDVTVEYYAHKVYDTLQELRLGKFIMAGHSLGGYITLAFAEKYPDLLKGFILFHSSAFADNDERKAGRNKTIEFIRKNGSKSFGLILVPPLFTVHNQEAMKDTVEMLTSIASTTPAASIIAASEAMRDRKDRTDVLKNTDHPVLFIIGKEDTAVPLEINLRQCHLPARSFACFLSGTAHMGMFEKPRETLDTIKGFIDICQKKD